MDATGKLGVAHPALINLSLNDATNVDLFILALHNAYNGGRQQLFPSPHRPQLH